MFTKRIVLTFIMVIISISISCIGSNYIQHGNPTDKIFVRNNVVYVSGTSYEMFYWENGIKKLSDYFICSLHIDNNGVYLLTADTSNINGNISYFINDNKFDTGIVGEPTSIYVYDDNVYITGKDNNNWFYWSEDGGYNSLETIWDVSSIKVYNDKVYLLGDCGDYPCYWVDGTIHELEALSAVSMKIIQGKVYIAGSMYDPHRQLNACYWIDGQKQIIEPGEGYDITVDGSDIYVSGINVDGNGCYWKNGERKDFNKIREITGITYSNETLYLTGYNVRYSTNIVDATHHTYYSSYYWIDSEINILH